MNTDIVKGRWKEMKGNIRKKWGKLTDDDVTTMQGTFEELSGKIQTIYGYQKDQADQEINDFINEEKL